MTRASINPPIKKMSDDSIKPLDYINYARRDLVDNWGSRGTINALSNIKRAIDCQLDVLLEIYGLDSISSRMNFPDKIQILRKIGVASPSILNRINAKRNEMEHEHKKVERKKVMEYLDIAELFIELYKNRRYKTRLFIDYDLDYALWFDDDNNEIKIYDQTDRFLEFGGIAMFKEYINKHKTKPIKMIPISNLEAWVEVCNKYQI